MARSQNRRERREPTFAGSRTGNGLFGLFADPKERRGGQKGGSAGGGQSGGNGSGRRKGRRRRGGVLATLTYWGFMLCVWAFIGVAGLVAYHATKLPPISELAVPKRPPNIAILAADGSLLANRGETGGRTMSLSELPKHLPQAFIAIEDHRFYSHWGVDPLGIARAVMRNLTARGLTQGGSTLTQQLAKNLFLTQERTASRKIQEAILAIWLERNYTKDQILELYLNRVYFGSGAYGIEAAAQKYFGKSARAVSVAEAAMLAGLVQAPSRLAPNRNPDGAEARANLVIAAMVREGFITEKSASVALGTPAEAVTPVGAGTSQYAADYVMDVLDDFIGKIDQDIVVETTLDNAMQNAAERALVDELNAKGARFGVGQGALVSLTPNGAIKALVGGRNYAASQFNRAVAAKRQPGSAFKPFVYLAALEQGRTPESVVVDGPVTIKGWSPENYSRDYFGPVPLTKALALSLNTVAVKLGQEVGPRSVVRVAQRLGIHSPLQANASLPLGTSEVSPLELAGAFAPFANGGEGIVPHIITRARTTSGKVLYKREPVGLGRVVDANAVAMMNAMMRETLTAGTARKAELPGWDAAGKTGTSQEFRDAWFVGYTSRLVTAVWLGNDDGTPTKKVSGGNLPVEIWSRYMKAAHQGQSPQRLPGGYYQVAPVDLDGASEQGTLPPGAIAQPRPQRGPMTSPTVTNERAIEYPRERGFLERLFGG